MNIPVKSFYSSNKLNETSQLLKPNQIAPIPRVESRVVLTKTIDDGGSFSDYAPSDSATSHAMAVSKAYRNRHKDRFRFLRDEQLLHRATSNSSTSVFNLLQHHTQGEVGCYYADSWRFNKEKKKWVKKGPLAVVNIIDNVIAGGGGNSILLAYYLYGMKSVAFNFKAFLFFSSSFRFDQSSLRVVFSTNGHNQRIENIEQPVTQYVGKSKLGTTTHNPVLVSLAEEDSTCWKLKFMNENDYLNFQNAIYKISGIHNNWLLEIRKRSFSIPMPVLENPEFWMDKNATSSIMKVSAYVGDQMMIQELASLGFRFLATNQEPAGLTECVFCKCRVNWLSQGNQIRGNVAALHGSFDQAKQYRCPFIGWN